VYPPKSGLCLAHTAYLRTVVVGRLLPFLLGALFDCILV